jgi:hypothetical protein
MAMRLSLRLSSALLLAAPLAWAVGCGGVTDIGFQGYDSGVSGSGGSATTGGAGGSTTTGGTGGGITDGGTGGIADGGAGGTVNTGGSGNASGLCGGVVCPDAPFPQVESCCTNDKCGFSSSFIGGQCIEANQPGKPDASCPDMSMQGFTLPGCCKPNGMCGVQDTFIGLGCVDPSQFGGPPSQPCGSVVIDAGTGGTGGTGGVPNDSGVGVGTVNCGSNNNPGTCNTGEKCCVLAPGLDYCESPSATCQCTNGNCNITEVTCDGNEDCGSGQMCCGIISGNSYAKTVCQSSCNGTTEREICHPGGTCVTPNTTCSHPQALPQYIWRCF